MSAMTPAPQNDDAWFLREAIRLSREPMLSGDGGPFGAIVVRDGAILGSGSNQVTTTQDPTAHAEIVALRAACRHLGDHRLPGCVLYTSCEPCPMCLAVAYWARIDRLVFAATRDDAAAAGFDDAFLYRELALPLEARTLRSHHLLRDEAKSVFTEWQKFPNRVPY